MRFLTSHKAFLLLVGVNAVAFVLLNAVTFPRQSLAAPTVGAPVPLPATISVGEPSDVTVTSQITSGPSDPAVIPTGVYLQRLDTTGKVIANLGTMRDDGAAGDAAAGDGVFTLRVTLNEPNPGEVRLRVSAAFRGLLRRVLSPIVTMSVWPIIRNTDLGLAFTAPSDWSVTQHGTSSLDVAGHAPGAPPPAVPGSLEGMCKISIVPADNPENLSLEEFVSRLESDPSSPRQISKMSLTIGGKQAIQMVTEEVARQTTTWLTMNGRIFLVHLICGDAFQTEGERIYLTLLETLEF